VARLVYLGTPEAAVAPLEALVRAGHDIALVVSRPDKRRGRGAALMPSPVKEAALVLGLPVTDRLDDVSTAGAELGVVVAYGRLIPPAVLDRLPMVNLHFSLLPRWRGAAPVERAVLAGDTETGVCLMALEEGLDTGPVYAEQRVPIDDEEDTDDLRRRLVDVGCRILVDTLSQGVARLPEPVPQVGEPTYAEKIRPDELELHWERSTEELSRVVRLGRAWTTFRRKRLRVLRVRVRPRGAAGDREVVPGLLRGPVVSTGDGELELVEVQPEGKQPMGVDDWLRGARPAAGEHVGT